MDYLDFSGKRVLVIGGSSGIGNGMAHEFRKAGAEVHVWGTRPRAEDYAGEEGSDLAELHYASMDVSDFAAIDAYEPPFASLDVLVCCQGIAIYNQAEFRMDTFQKVVDVNLNSLMACGNKFHDMLAACRGAYIIVSSTAAFHSTRGNPAYNASKTGALGLTRTLGEAWARDGIRVNGIAPGYVATKMTKVTTDNPERLEGALKRIPLRRMGEPSELGRVALFLASPLSSYVLGHTIPVDGGLIL